MDFHGHWRVLVVLAGTLWLSQSLALAAESPLVFTNVTQEVGLLSEVSGIRGHGAGWGDVDGDGWLDLYVATFHNGGSKPNMLLRNDKGRFRLDEQPALRISTRATGVLFADLDNDGDLDLYVASMPADADSDIAKREGHPIAGCSLFRNDGAGRFTNISEGNGACPKRFGGRSATVLDYDGDGLLDLLVGEDPLPGYNGSPTKSSRLFRNTGDLKFKDVSRGAGLPEGVPGLGVAAADVNNDGWPDFFLAAHAGGNRLFLNSGRGHFHEAAGSREVFSWDKAGGDNMVCGIAFGDVNRDGLLDVVIGQHFEQPWLEPVANRLYLNQGIKEGIPRFKDVTQSAGLRPLPMKAPHVEVQDFDNDGWPDISTSIVAFDKATARPVIFRNLGVSDGLPRFRESALASIDFPTAEDRAIRRSGPLFEKIVKDGKIMYAAPGPSGDYDNDGRLDFFLPSWWIEAPSLLLRNETPGGNWLQVQIEAGGGVNRQGIGSRISVYPAGELGERGALLGCREVATGFGYASGQPSITHFGLGPTTRVDVEVRLLHGKGTLVRKDVQAKQRLTINP